MDMPASEALIVAIDFESTGTVPGYPDEPWQVGIMPLRMGEPRPDEAWESLLKVSPGRPFNPNAPGSWRLVQDRLGQAPDLAGLWPILGRRLKGAALVAHNAATERKFLRKAWPLHRVGPWIDTLALCRKAFSGLGDYRLGAVLKSLGIEDGVGSLVTGRGAHDALYDAGACAALLCHLLRQPGWEGVTVEALVRASRADRSSRRGR